MFKVTQCLFTLSFLVTACGNKSGSHDEAPLPETPKLEEPLKFTAVPAEFFQAAFPEGFACTDYLESASLPFESSAQSEFKNSPLALERGVWDWSQGLAASRVFDDGQRAIHVWRSDDELKLGLAAEGGTFDDLEIIFFGMVEQKDELLIEKVSTYSLNRFQLLQSDHSKAIHKDIYTMPLNDFLHVLHWPNFIIQFQSKSLARPVQHFYVGILEASEGPFSPGYCQDWLRRRTSLYLQTLMSRSPGKADRATKAAGILREALEDAFSAFGPGWRQAHIPTIFSDLPVHYSGFSDSETRDFAAVIRTEKFSDRYHRDDGQVQAYEEGLLAYWRLQLAAQVGASYAKHDPFVLDTLSYTLVFSQITERISRIQALIYLEQSLSQAEKFPGSVVLGWGLAQLIDKKGLASLLADAKTLRILQDEKILLAWMQDQFPELEGLDAWQKQEGLWATLNAADAAADQDDDSLSDLMEIFTNSLSTKHDSDGDRWNDYAEYIARTGPQDQHDRPKILVQDGDMVDWFELLPTKIREIAPDPGQCEVKDAMDWVGALSEEDRLLIAVHRKKGSRLPGYDWLVKITVPERNQVFSMRIGADAKTPGKTQQEINVKAEEVIKVEGKADAKSEQKFVTRQGRVFSEKGLELAFDPMKFGLSDLNLLKSDALLVQISLLQGKGKQERLCGQTPWFSPVSRD